MADLSTHLGLLTLYLVMEASRSLKDKRRILHGFRDRVRARFDVSFAEVGHQESHHRAIVAIACVGSDRGEVERTLDQIRRVADTRDGAVVSDWTLEWR